MLFDYWYVLHTHGQFATSEKKRDMSTARRRLKSPRSLSGTSADPTMVTLVNIYGYEWMTHIILIPCQSAAPFTRYSNFRLWPWNSKVKVMNVVKGQCRTVGPVSYQLISFSFHINQTKQILRYSYFEIWPWNIQGQGHEWGQRSRSHIIPSIKPMHFLFVSHQSDQSFLRYGQKRFWPWTKHTQNVQRNLPKCQFSKEKLQNLIR